MTAASLAPQAENTASSATTGLATTTSPTADGRLTNGPAPAAAIERGAILFAVKGCVGCHMHSAFPNTRMQIGPDLTYLANRAATRVAGLDAVAYVRQSLREPSAYRATANFAIVMPDLGLSDEQVESLTAFLLSSSR